MAERMKREFVVGVDVGTASVRAGVFDLRGKLVGFSASGISLWKPRENFVEQSSEDIWSAACKAVRTALRLGQVRPSSVAGISFDATCSLVALDESDHSLTLSATGKKDRNIIVWMDHRAVDQAQRINASHHRVLRYVGGIISPEMETPKLLWVKENLPETWRRAAKFLDLADFMTYRSTGVDTRSLCTTVCKWTYRGLEGAWDKSFFRTTGMSTLLSKKKIGRSVLPMGTRLGNLTERSARELGLTARTNVAVGIIDAHAGGIGILGMGFDTIPTSSQLEEVLALIGGTSSCHMAVSREPRFIHGVWGPYYSAMVPGLWLNEGGQSSTGSFIDFMIRNTGQYAFICREAEKRKSTVYGFLNGVIRDMIKRERSGPEIVKSINILPYVLGNRSPHADPAARGVLSGLTLDDSVESAARIYYAAIQAVAFGTRDIIGVMNRSGYRIRRIHACGGGTKNPLWLREHANITGCEIVLPGEPEAVVLGTAIIAAVGAGKYKSILEAANSMSTVGETIRPETTRHAYYDAKYKVFREMYRDFKRYQKRLDEF